MPSRSIPVVKHDTIAFFLWLNNIPIRIFKYTTFSSFIYRWALRLPPYLGDCKQCCNEHEVNMFFELILLFYSDKYPEMELLDHEIIWGFSLVVQMIKNLLAMQDIQETWVRFLGHEDPVEKGMAIHSSILAWKSPWMEKPDGLQSMGSQKVRHNWAINFHFSRSFLIWRGSVILFYIAVVPIYIPTNNIQGFILLYIFANNLSFLVFFGNGHSNQCEVVILICISLMISDTEHLFMYLLVIWMSYLEKQLFIYLLTFNWLLGVFCY